MENTIRAHVSDAVRSLSLASTEAELLDQEEVAHQIALLKNRASRIRNGLPADQSEFPPAELGRGVVVPNGVRVGERLGDPEE